MFKDDIHFLDDTALDVKVFTKSGLFVGEGELRFSNKSTPCVAFSLRVNVEKFVKNTLFFCEASGGTYTLINCDVVQNSIQPRLIVKGKKKDGRFKKISVLLQGVSEWMDSDGQFKISNQEIVRKREQKVFNVDVLCSDGRTLTISCEHWCEVQHQEANNHLVKECTVITCEIKSGYWSALDLIRITNDIRTVFSLLLGFPLGVEYVLDRTLPKRMQSVYFLNSTEENNPVSKVYKCFVSSTYLFSQNKWADLFNSFFGVNGHEYYNFWARVAGMLSYEGFWEHKILSYVSLVDRYVSLCTKSSEKRLPDKKFKKLKRKIKSSLSEYKLEENDDKYNSVFESLDQQIQQFKNSSFLSFSEKFEFTMGKLNQEIRDIIDLSSEDFQHLKRLRNSVAHGNEPSIKDDDNYDITHEVILSSKLALLLFYWVYSDLGFSDKDFIVFLNNWMHPVTSQAYLNTQALDKALGQYLYLKTNKTNFIKAKNHQFGCLVLDYVKRSDSYRVNTITTAAAERWSRNTNKSKRRSIEEELMSIVDTSVVKKIAYVGIAYMQYEDNVFKSNMGICVLNSPDYLAKDKCIFDRLRVFDDESRQWLLSASEKRRLERKKE